MQLLQFFAIIFCRFGKEDCYGQHVYVLTVLWEIIRIIWIIRYPDFAKHQIIPHPQIGCTIMMQAAESLLVRKDKGKRRRRTLRNTYQGWSTNGQSHE